ncbi:MAG TPA: hypothetical protein EYN96_01550 [Candidatus Hydrogenedentes bacterium]|nr:hypothetical protein [Candidatus Hydrogenedentota bacterium]
MSQSIPEGFYQDSDGKSQQDRRADIKNRRGGQKDRRSDRKVVGDEDRRNLMRRASDAAFLKSEHSRQIEDALEDFAKDHDA